MNLNPWVIWKMPFQVSGCLKDLLRDFAMNLETKMIFSCICSDSEAHCSYPGLGKHVRHGNVTSLRFGNEVFSLSVCTWIYSTAN